jgi:P4 family phage/plasmid primase-like protien
MRTIPEEPSLLGVIEIQVFNDTALAQWFDHSYFKGEVKFSAGFGWSRWTGVFWESTDEREIRKDVATQLQTIERHLREQGASIEALKAIGRRLSTGSLKALIAQLESQVFVKAAFFENSPDLLNAQNGVIDLRTGELLPHDPRLGFTKVLPTSYIPDATHPDWDAALGALEPEVAETLQVAVGQGVTGYSPLDDRSNFFVGPKASNGKSTIVNGILGAFGGFARLVSEKVLAGNKFDHPTEKMQLFGTRIAIVEELPQALLNDKQLKDLTSRVAQGRYMRMDNVEWTATHTVFVTTNHPLEFENLDNGVMRRVRIFPFEKEYVDNPTDPNHMKKDLELRERIMQGQEGQHEAILAWAVKGAVRWFKAGRKMPPEPASLAVAREAWQKDADVVGAFFEEYMEPSEGSFVATVELLAAFNHFLEARGLKPWRMTQLKTAFEARPDLANYRNGVVRPRNAEDRSIPEIPKFFPTTSSQPPSWRGMKFIVEQTQAEF